MSNMTDLWLSDVFFSSSNIETLMICYSYFGVNLPSVILRNRVIKFEQKFAEVHKVVV